MLVHSDIILIARLLLLILLFSCWLVGLILAVSVRLWLLLLLSRVSCAGLRPLLVGAGVDGLDGWIISLCHNFTIAELPECYLSVTARGQEPGDVRASCLRYLLGEVVFQK